MKKLYYLITLLLLSSLFAGNIYAQEVIVTDDASYTTPADGAILDVYSLTKGMVIPRMANTAAVESPSNGMIVYSNATTSFWVYQNNAWYEVTSSTSSGVVNIDQIVVGDVTNNFTVTADGTVSLNGTATCWNDFLINPSTARNSGSTVPGWEVFVATDISTWMFSDTRDEAIAFSVQLPHDFKEGSTIYPHIHWAPMSAAGLTRPTWIMEYQWVNLGDAFTATTGTSAIGYLLYNDGASPSVELSLRQSTLTPLGSGIVGTDKTISSILMCRLYRSGNHGNDNLQADAALLSIDFHYEIDGFGSSTPFTK